MNDYDNNSDRFVERILQEQGTATDPKILFEKYSDDNHEEAVRARVRLEVDAGSQEVIVIIYGPR